ncbi:hypothetical protein BAE30_06115 [Acidithiobacillus caldus]|uniref:Uncharacterized protein n=1 Tax=Acidithiobacillus caldus TaxID=33059 RepID=A0A1E7YX90_9PROT|nr:hypothetical protein BAE30_06115 [Acidithiobacillus caldus]
MESVTEVSSDKLSMRERVLAELAVVVSPRRAGVVAAVVGGLSAATAFASGQGASTAANFLTGTIVPDVGVIAVALMTLAASVYGIKWLLALIV